MDLQSARDLQAELLSIGMPYEIALGIAPIKGDYFELAVRVQHETPETVKVLAYIEDQARGEVDVQVIGTPQLQCSCEPYAPGASCGREDAGVGTLGPLVTVQGTEYVVSNNHVLANNNQGRPGDEIWHPGAPHLASADHDPPQRIGTLAGFIPLNEDGPNTVDAALCTLDDGIDFSCEISEVLDPGELVRGIRVAKRGWATGHTEGHVTAFEMNNFHIWCEPLGHVLFADQIQIEPDSGSLFFSLPGDSGALVYEPETKQAVGLIFAATRASLEPGRSATYVNPMPAVLDQLGAALTAR
ncbi:hypothetical protein KDK95_05635 [Actinospica sp. MGRD01-02]|uniref:Serine protease n=1 Tax=Actinospica acidithermotolerans TaxID=2828514 RepID=A0A941E656_9ACTN|nr:hypothetical protein [Actinospica acidithermotolerans]MBR7825781.1 hypothetical protein [Actinospica acidithermotolerans]